MLETLIPALLALGGLFALLEQARRARAGYKADAAARQAAAEHRERLREQDRRHQRRRHRQQELAEWTGTFNALLLERRLRTREPAPQPAGEPIAVIRAWDGTVVGTVYEDPPDYRASNAAAIEREIATPLFPGSTP